MKESAGFEAWQKAHVDLHMHSNVSDGTFAPQALVVEAAKQNLAFIALTDHDTLDGLAEARKKAEELGIAFLDGVEVSSSYSQKQLHILGYGVNPQDANLQAALEKVRGFRRERNRKILELLVQEGIAINEEELTASCPPGTVIGRPHIAKLLIQKGVVANHHQAFRTYLGENAKAYRVQRTMPKEEVVEQLKKAGGQVFIAHPVTLRLPADELRSLLLELKAVGLDGIEAYNSVHSHDEVVFLLEMAKQLGLKISGGSDFHGDSKGQVKMGAAWNGKKITGSMLSEELFQFFS